MKIKLKEKVSWNNDNWYIPWMIITIILGMLLTIGLLILAYCFIQWTMVEWSFIRFVVIMVIVLIVYLLTFFDITKKL